MPTRESSSLERSGLRRARPAQETRRHLDEYVRRARLAGASWQVMGSALGITRQSAWERFRNLPGCAAKGTATSRLPRPPAQRSATKQDSVAETQKRVQRMRSAGASWRVIGSALSITRQSAWGTVPVYMHIPEKSRDSRRRTPSTTSAATYLFCLGDRGCQGR